MLEATLAAVAIISTLAAPAAFVLILHTLSKMQAQLLAHFERNHPIGGTIAHIAEKEMAFNAKVHADRIEESKQMRAAVLSRQANPLD